MEVHGHSSLSTTRRKCNRVGQKKNTVSAELRLKNNKKSSKEEI
jgi:hypothetical protein